jgi:hypothetical protein
MFLTEVLVIAQRWVKETVVQVEREVALCEQVFAGLCEEVQICPAQPGASVRRCCARGPQEP